MWQYRNEAVAVARRSTVWTSLSFAGDAHAHLIIDARGNLHFGRNFLEHLPASPAAWAWVLDRRALAMAGGARRLNPHDAGRLNDPALPAAVATHFAAAAVGRS